jgi:hypothetical protein
METDKQRYKLFTAAPAQLYLLLGFPAPQAVRARAETFKDVQTRAERELQQYRTDLENLEPRSA